MNKGRKASRVPLVRKVLPDKTALPELKARLVRKVLPDKTALPVLRARPVRRVNKD